ncbi:MAG: glycosyltransferase family 2 protein [Hyphomicrobiaceae bacterium]
MMSDGHDGVRSLSPEDFISGEPVKASRRPISVVIPVLNEGRTINLMVQRVVSALEALGNPFELIVVDDGSTDRTLEALRGLHDLDDRVRAISFSRNFGKEVAVAAGLRHATGDAVIIMDGDLQHPPETIGRFVNLWDQGYDMVYGQRTDRSLNTRLERLSARSFYRVFYFLSGTHLPDGAGDFRLLDRRIIDVYNALPERARFNKGLYAWMGFKSIGVPFDVAERHGGKSRWAFRRLLRFAIDGIASFTTVPLKVWSYIGILLSGMALVYALYVMLTTLIWGADVPGYPTIIVSVLFLGGIQLISLGVLGEYLGRVYEEVKGRPLYIVADRIGLDEPTSRGRRQADHGAAAGALLQTPARKSHPV